MKAKTNYIKAKTAKNLEKQNGRRAAGGPTMRGPAAASVPLDFIKILILLSKIQG